MLDALAQFIGAIIMAAVVFCAAIFGLSIEHMRSEHGPGIQKAPSDAD